MTTNHASQLFPLSIAQRKALTGKLNQKRVSSRSQGGRSLSYLEAWDVRTALIRVFGFGGWSGEVLEQDIVEIARDIPKLDKDGKQVGLVKFRVAVWVRFQLTIHQTGATYTELAAASQSGADLGEVMDFAFKTAASDAMKRGAMNLGTQFGLSLYDNGSINDVVRLSLAPGQEWPAVAVEKEHPDQDAPLQLAEERDNERADTVTTSPEGEPEQ
jgi:recombination DNA repair RAD52 pathway protein